MSNEIRANRAWHGGEPGFYVVNRETDIAVSGPFRAETQAAHDKAARDARYPLDPSDRLLVYEIAGSPSDTELKGGGER